jgi:DNA invertase Pin-like site-specific DNA recombinase
MQEFVAYRRVTASEQGRSGLELEAQAAAILRFVQARHGVLLQDFVEHERGKGSQGLDRRPQLRDAIATARRRAAVLVVSRLDRLSRNAGLIADLIASGVVFVAAETPEADAAMLHGYAAVAQREREQVSRRISAALQAKKRAALARGLPNPLGNSGTLTPGNSGRTRSAQAFAARLAPILDAYRHAGLTQRRMVEALNHDGIPTAAGGTWSLVQLQRVLARLAKARTADSPRD